MSDDHPKVSKTAIYPVLVQSDAERPEAGYGLMVPDLPGCFSAGDTYEELAQMGREAIELHLQSYLDDGQAFPEPTPVSRLDHYLKDPEYGGEAWLLIEVTLPDQRGEWRAHREAPVAAA